MAQVPAENISLLFWILAQHQQSYFLFWLIWLIDIFYWKPNRLSVPSYRESHVSGKGVPKSREINIGMPQRRRQREVVFFFLERECTGAILVQKKKGSAGTD